MDAVNTVFKLLYNGKNISEDVSLNLLRITYIDNVTGVADSLEIVLEDTDEKWSNSWYPSKGAILQLEFGNINEPVLKPNDFEISTINLSGSKTDGDVVVIKAISGGINKQLHTKRSHAHENKTLSGIVHSVAQKYGLTVIGNIANITIGRVTQHREKDITFLNRLADEYGYAFSIKGSKLSFIPLKSLESLKRVGSIDKTECIEWEIDDKGFDTYSAATVKSHNPNQNRVVSSTYTVEYETNKDGEEFSYLKKANNSLEVRTKTENEQQANAKSEAALHKANSLQQTATIKIIGNTLYLAGCNMELTGFGANSGIWHILKSTHSYQKSKGYETDLELKRVVPAKISGSKKTAKTTNVKKPEYKVVSKLNNDQEAFNYLVKQ